MSRRTGAPRASRDEQEQESRRAARKRAKVYIFTDMEGVSGIHRFEYTDPSNPKYQEGRRLLTADVNAAVAGAFDGGAGEVVVSDGHWGGDNFLIDQIDPRALIDHGGAGRWCGCLDETFGAVMIVGQHAKAGTLNGFLDHTQSSTTWFEFTLNGKAVGEIGQFACMAGAFDVPVVMVAGDKAATEEAIDLLGPIEVVSVKEGVGRSTARCLAPEAAHRLIREGAARALKLAGRIAPYKPKTPIEVVLRVTRSDHADSIALRPGNERLDARTIRRRVDDPLHIFDLFMETRPRT